MPKTPITYRETFFAKIRGSGSGGNTDRNPQLKPCDWNHVETDLGIMVEPRQPLTITGLTAVSQIDMTDASINKVTVLDDEGSFQNDYLTGGPQLPIDFNA